jgi:dimethylglycine dehydrogenase
VKPSALYDDLRAAGAVFEEVYGWERPRWFAPEGVEARDIYGFGRTALHDIVGSEVRAVRERAGIMDISAFAKIEVAGADAAAFLDRMIANRLPRAGRIGLGHLLTEGGRIECEVAVLRIAADRFYLVSAAFFEQRLLDLLTVARMGEAVEIANRSSTWGAVALNGPRSRDILGTVTPARLDNAAFPWLSAQEIEVAGHRVLALRMSYAGELGWELHGERPAILAAFRALTEAGRPHGLVHYGSFAMNAMRMEKAFKGAGELTNEVTLAEADAMRFVSLDKEFRGRDATARSAAGSLRWVCVYLEVEADGRADGNGGEAVLAGGTQVGAISSIAYGHAVGKLLAFAYVSPDHAAPGTALEVVVMGHPRAARVLAAPAHDPESRLPRMEAEEVAAQ